MSFNIGIINRLKKTEKSKDLNNMINGHREKTVLTPPENTVISNTQRTFPNSIGKGVSEVSKAPGG